MKPAAHMKLTAQWNSKRSKPSSGHSLEATQPLGAQRYCRTLERAMSPECTFKEPRHCWGATHALQSGIQQSLQSGNVHKRSCCDTAFRRVSLNLSSMRDSRVQCPAMAIVVPKVRNIGMQGAGSYWIGGHIFNPPRTTSAT